MAEDSQQTTDETEHLLSSPANAERLRRSIQQATDAAPSLLTLGSEEGGTIRLRPSPDGRLEFRVTSVVPATTNNNLLDRNAATMIRDAINRWLHDAR